MVLSLSVGNDTWDGLYYAFGLYLCLVTGSLANQHTQNFLYHVGNRQELQYLLLFFEVLCLEVQPATAEILEYGAVVNLLSNDAQNYMM